MAVTNDDALIRPAVCSPLTSSSAALLPLAAAPPFLNAQKMARLVKAMVRLVRLCVCVCLCAKCTGRQNVSLRQLSRGYTFTSSLSSSVPSFPLFVPQRGRHFLWNSAWTVSAWTSCSDCNPNDCSHHVSRSDQVRLFLTVFESVQKVVFFLSCSAEIDAPLQRFLYCRYLFLSGPVVRRVDCQVYFGTVK